MKSAIYCNHANECPARCDCPSDCYCKAHTCRSRELPVDKLRGKFIVFDGPDGAGKTTQLKNLSEYLQSRGLDICEVREPGGTKIGQSIRELLLNPESEIGLRSEMLLYMAARAQLVEEVINPALLEGKLVLADRFVSSTFAYQGGGGGLAPHHIMNVSRAAIGDTVPDLTLIFHVDEVTVFERTCGKFKDRIEQRDVKYYRRVRRAYINLAGMYPDHNALIDASGSIDDVFEDVKMIVGQRLINNI